MQMVGLVRFHLRITSLVVYTASSFMYPDHVKARHPGGGLGATGERCRSSFRPVASLTYADHRSGHA